MNGAAQTSPALNVGGSLAAAHVEESALGWGSGDPVRAHALDAAALRVAGVSAPHVHEQRSEDRRGHLDGARSPGPPKGTLAHPAAAELPLRPRPSPDDGDPPIASTSAPDKPAASPGPHSHLHRPGGRGAPAGRGGDRSGSAGADTPSMHSSSTVSPPRPGLAPAASGRNAGLDGRGAGGSSGTRSRRPVAHIPAELPRPPRPRLLPPPAPLTWPDYPYTRRPAASAASPHDEAALKLEALFQCVLHYPRVPPKLLRFLQRAAPGAVADALPHVTATVERLAAVCGREVAVYLIRRRPWVVLVGADWIVPRIEAVRQLLALPPGAMLDMLRKNPNLLRMERATLRARYEALADATDFDPEQLSPSRASPGLPRVAAPAGPPASLPGPCASRQVRALVVKYPLILNFQPDSVASAAAALRRLCRARPSWAAHHDILSPSQFAFFMRDRVHTLLRLEYLLITGAGGSWTVRDIIKASNNMFKKVYSGFRSWSTERLRRLRERMRRVRETAEAEGRLEREAIEEAEAAAGAEYGREEAQRFSRQYGERRQLELADAERRAEQRKVALELKQQQQQQLEAQQDPGESGSKAEEEEQAAAHPKRRPGRREEQRARDAAEAAAGAEGGRGSAAGGAAASASSGAARTEVPAGGSAQRAAELAATGGSRRRTSGPPSISREPVDGDPLSALSPGRVWQRPGGKVRQLQDAEDGRADPHGRGRRATQQQQQGQAHPGSEPVPEQPQQQQQRQQWGEQGGLLEALHETRCYKFGAVARSVLESV
ncbi:hypothetical protein TSOC_008838 [Tetrabaena socialis]|uniref:Uncharacterized protein n=1 Tax=Tetrabaena socialis TaxID=47790 RepID=A0A2J7ZXH2_9CHLO|nr:hypothetical protein TSOC_008838 [Tetrabaena socialis]|eukprot:PNH04956.1 hypothetical protein TSOC_008838 [Tetrabaena socialis]